MRRKATIAVGVVLAAAAVVAATIGGRATPAQAASSDLASCTNVKLGMMAPLTGPAAFLGQEQLSWVNFAVSRFNQQSGTKFGVVQGDSQLSASLARTVGRKFAADRSILGVVGGSTSQSVISSAGLFKVARLASVSGSATRADLTRGQYPTFFRVVPNDTQQSLDISRFIAVNLKAKKVTVIDSQDDYSVPLADGVEKLLKARKLTVDRQSVSATETDFSTVVTNVDSDTNVVLFATQTASAANTLSQQLIEQGKKALVFGTDGAYAPSQYKPKHGYVSSFANDIHFLPAAKPVVAAYNSFSKNKTFGTFGPPSYLAAWVLMNAIKNACADDTVTRAEVVTQVRRTNIPSLLGGTIRFDRLGNPLPKKFYIFEVTNGTYKNVA
jgi:branched-chain amino acid transport system substrate-binding protein